MTTSSTHWDRIYTTTDESKLGWYEQDLSQTLSLLDSIENLNHSRIFIPGIGTSQLIEALLKKDVELVLNDISQQAINRVQQRLSSLSNKIHWLHHDISQAFTASIPAIDIWIDRAVLHFLLKEEDIMNYFNNLKSVLKIGGHCIFAEFSPSAPAKCAGLKVHPYCNEELLDKLGEQFKLITSFDHTYINPVGETRPYIYGLYQRTA